jgi:hypothetical protein
MNEYQKKAKKVAVQFMLDRARGKKEGRRTR